MPTDSLKEQYLQALKAALEGIVAGATYWMTVKKVERENTNPLNGGVYPALCIVVQENAKGPNLSFGSASGPPTPFGMMGQHMAVTLNGRLQATPDHADRDANRLLHDMEIAVMTLDEDVIGGAKFETNIVEEAAVVAGASEPDVYVSMVIQVAWRYQRGRPALA